MTAEPEGSAVQQAEAAAPAADVAQGGQEAQTDVGRVAMPWDGEFEHLEEQDFFRVIPEEHREPFRTGYKAKLDHLTRGFHGKMQELTTREKKMLEDVKQREEAVRRMMYGEDDPTKPLNERISALEKESGEWKKKFEDLTTATQQRVVEALASDCEKNHPEIWNNDKAYDDYCTLIAAGVDPARAVVMVKATIEDAPEPSKAEAAMSGDEAGGKVAVGGGSWEEVKSRYLGT